MVIKNILSNSAEGNHLVMEFILFNILKDLPSEVIDDIAQELNLHSDDENFIFDFNLRYPNLFYRYSISFMTCSSPVDALSEKRSFITITDKTTVDNLKYEFEYSRPWCPLSVINTIREHNRLKNRKLCDMNRRMSNELYKIALSDSSSLDLLLAIREGVETEVHFKNEYSLVLVEDTLSLHDKDNNEILSEKIHLNSTSDSNLTLNKIFNPWLDILIDMRDLG